MDILCKEALKKQFGAAIEMFGNALQACPGELWTAHMWKDSHMPPEFSDFWYVAYHNLFWLDLYLSGGVAGFSPPQPFTLTELDAQGALPERAYTQTELLSYLDHCRQKCLVTIEQLTDEHACRLCYFTWAKDGITFVELLLDNMRHVQDHAAQLNMFLGQHIEFDPHWVG